MGYGFIRSRGSRFEQLGFSGSGSTTTVTSGATAGTFGTLTSIGTSTFVYDAITLSIATASVRRGICTITANISGTDVIIADSIPFCNEAVANSFTSHTDLPIRIPSGATLKAKVATQPAGSSTMRVAITGYNSSALVRGFSQIVSCTDLTSSDPSNPITLTSTTLTGWVQVRATTPNNIGALWATPICLNTSMGLGASGQIYIEIGYGGSGSEVALFRVPFVANTAFISQPFGIPCQIPSGTRLAARAQASTTATATISIACYGGVT